MIFLSPAGVGSKKGSRTAIVAGLLAFGFEDEGWDLAWAAFACLAANLAFFSAWAFSLASCFSVFGFSGMVEGSDMVKGTLVERGATI